MQSTLIDAQMAGVVGNALRDNGNWMDNWTHAVAL
jgi:hypothetical protein